MLIISADSDHTVPWAIANAAYRKEKRNQGVTEIVKMPSRGHALTIDAGWREVAEKALEFVKRFTQPDLAPVQGMASGRSGSAGRGARGDALGSSQQEGLLRTSGRYGGAV